MQPEDTTSSNDGEVADMTLYQPKKLHNFALANEGDIRDLSEVMQLSDALHIQTAMEHQAVILQDT
jgi:hypothetical protein